MKKIFIESLGCPKNTVDTEHVLGLLDERFDYSDDPEEADYIIVNTCAFIHDARTESLEFIEKYSDMKRRRDLKVIVMGCLAESQTELILKNYSVDAVVGTGSFFKMDEVIKRLESGERGVVIKDSIDTIFPVLPRVVTTPSHYAYLKIAEGCDNRCTYCLIPSLRGKYRSRTVEDIVNEAMALDVEELILIAQDTSRYGIDLYGEPKLSELLTKLNQIDRIRWIRVHYLYPDLLSDELIRTFFRLEKVVNYFDIPLQHVSDPILKRMNRKTSYSDLIRIFQKIREESEKIKSHAVIRTTFIVGFPGERDEDFQELLDFTNTHQIDRLGVFLYSDSPDIPSYHLPDKVDAETAEERRDRLMLLQQEKSLTFMEKYIGFISEAVVEEHLEDEDLYVCRTMFDSPEVDGELYVSSDTELEIGDFIHAEITDCSEYDLYGEFYEYCK